LEEINFPSSLKEIGVAAFAACLSLTGVIDLSHTQIETLGSLNTNYYDGSVFDSCMGDMRPDGIGITKVILPATLKHIGVSTFNDCPSLTEVDMSLCTEMTSLCTPDGKPMYTSSGTFFQNCTGLTTVKLPASLTMLEGTSMFFGCSALTNVNFADLVNVETMAGKNMFKNSGITTVDFSVMTKLTSIVTTESMFEGCKKLTGVVLPAGVAKLEKNMFKGCTALTTFAIPATVTEIGDYAFSGTALTEVTIPASVTKIGQYAFQNCASLRKVVFEQGCSAAVIASASYLFTGCSALEEVVLPDSLTKLPDFMFENCTSLKYVYSKPADKAEGKVVLPEALTTIGVASFLGCQAIEDVYMFDEVTEMGGNQFGYCTSLQHIRLSSNLTALGGWTFAGCISLEELNLPEGLTAISCYEFIGCSSLTELIFPSTLTCIGDAMDDGITDQLFLGCYRLERIVLPASVIELHLGTAFSGMDLNADEYFLAMDDSLDFFMFWLDCEPVETPVTHTIYVEIGEAFANVMYCEAWDMDADPTSGAYPGDPYYEVYPLPENYVFVFTKYVPAE
ncbi:MAG: leucine-rich repeat protein, partial [Clostridia bacterium]|nr:leucine-rich repeat protein [Clostridia bacterium]